MVWREEERTFGGGNRIGLGSPIGSKWRPATEIGLGSPIGATGDVSTENRVQVEAAPRRLGRIIVWWVACSPFALTIPFLHSSASRSASSNSTNGDRFQSANTAPEPLESRWHSRPKALGNVIGSSMRNSRRNIRYISWRKTSIITFRLS
jgi:hypothetical protein